MEKDYLRKMAGLELVTEALELEPLDPEHEKKKRKKRLHKLNRLRKKLNTRLLLLKKKSQQHKQLKRRLQELEHG